MVNEQSDSPLVTLLREIMRRRHRLPSQLGADIGISHASISRWLHGKDVPSTKSCRRLAEYSGIPVQKVLASSGHVPMVAEAAPDAWPEFREYASKKYGSELDDDIVTMIESLIERRRDRKSGRRNGSPPERCILQPWGDASTRPRQNAKPSATVISSDRSGPQER